MQKREINELLQRYNSQRGWFRWLFGNTKGIRGLQDFYYKLGELNDSDELELVHLSELEALMANRWQRLKHRTDTYLSTKGLKKLTNKIYKQLAEKVALSYADLSHSYGHCLLIPEVQNSHSTNGQAVDEIPLNDWFVINEGQKSYVLHPQSYAETLEAKDGFINPHTQNRLSGETIDRLLRLPVLGAVFYRIRQCLERIFVDKTFSQDNIAGLRALDFYPHYDTVIHLPTEVERLRGVLPKLSLREADDVVWNFNPILETLSVLERQAYRDCQQKKETLSRVSSREIIHAIEHLPLREVFVSHSERDAFSIKAFLKKYESTGELLHPITGQILSPQAFNRLYASISSQLTSSHPFVRELQSLVANPLNYQGYCRAQSLKNTHTLGLIKGQSALRAVQEDELFIVTSQHGFDIHELLASFSYEKGYVNPITDEPLSTEDLQSLRTNSKTATAMVRCDSVLSAYDQGGFKERKGEKLALILKTHSGLVDGENLISNYTSFEALQNPLTDKPLNSEELSDLIDMATNYTKKTKNSRQFLLDVRQGYEQYLFKAMKIVNQVDLLNRQIDVKCYSDKTHFLTSDHYLLDLSLFAQVLDTQGFINPYTKHPLSEIDIESLKSHPHYGCVFQALGQLLDGWNALGSKPSYTYTCKLSHLIVLSNGRVVDLYQEDNVLGQLIDTYMAKNITRTELLDGVSQLYDLMMADKALKQSLTTAEEATLVDNTVFQNLSRCLDIQEQYTLENLNKNLFWKFAESELNQMLKSVRQPPLSQRHGHTRNNATCSMFLALKDFDNDAARAKCVLAAGYSGNIIHSNSFGSEYVARVGQIYDSARAEHALINVVATFKGAFLAVLRHDRFKDLFNRMDHYGICVAEKTRSIAGWTMSLQASRGDVSRDILAVLADYQEELTGSNQSRSRFIENNDAVSFILERHQNQRFIFTDTNDEEQQGYITREIIVYYLKNYMGHDGLPEVPRPDCFNRIEGYAATI